MNEHACVRTKQLRHLCLYNGSSSAQLRADIGRFQVKSFRICGLALCLLLFCPLVLFATAADPKPGDTIGPDTWQKVHGMVGENLLQRIKHGYTFKIKESRVLKLPKEYIEATEKYSGKVTLGPKGELLNYVAGLPFRSFDPNDPQAGLKLAWNFYWRWTGDDYKNAGGIETGKIIRDVIESDGSERRGNISHHYIKTRGRVTLDIKPNLPGYEHIDWMQIRADEYPRDTSGTTTLEIRYASPNREDDFYIYVPSIRRVRRPPPVQRCASLAPSEFNSDDVNSFNGKITDFDYRYLGEKKMLGNFSQAEIPFRRKRGEYLPLTEKWEVHDAHVLEIIPKDKDYCYPRKILYIDKVNSEPLWTMIWDRQGNYWKEMFTFRTPVRLSDGREVLSAGTVVIVNTQNARSTVTTAVRAYNQGYQPTIFTLATLQTVMRGGAIR
jgi:Protein of unknown function (DUF1329)